MKIIHRIRALTNRRGATRAEPSPSPAGDYALTDARDLQIAENGLQSLEQQMHAVIDKNADGVNRLALKIRSETDLLLSLGISDRCAARAGSMAQVALELANFGRGVNLQEQTHDLPLHLRVHAVAKSMAFVTRAESLLRTATRENHDDIQIALKRQTEVINQMLGSSFAKGAMPQFFLQNGTPC